MSSRPPAQSADHPAEIYIGDSLIMVSKAGERELFPAVPYIYVDDADRAYRRAVAAGAASLEEPNVNSPYGDGRAMSVTTSATSSSSPTGS
jgi:uncharacterized glyoxalase superfamily protein PhnB